MKNASNSKRKTRPHCYICGALHQLTDDHIPPCGFFPSNDRENLIAAPLCRRCHRPLAKSDETMRAWLSAGGQSAAARWIWKRKIVGSTFRRSPKLRAYIREHHFRPIIDPVTGKLVAGELTYFQRDANPFIRRLTKGFLYTLHPEYDYFSDHFAIGYRPPEDDILPLVRKLTLVERGTGVFRLWHGVTETNDAGVCVYLFYDGVCFVCFHGKGEHWKQQLPEGYEESPQLPERL